MKILTAPHMERCIGCLLCVLESGKEKGEISLSHSLVRILTKDGGGFVAEIDRGREASEKIAQVCPRNCLAVVEA